MAIFDRFDIKVVASAGLCAAAIALSPDAAAASFSTGGYACIQSSAGAASGAAAAGAPVAGGGAGAAAGCIPASAPVADMAGIPMALPGPVPVVPAAAPVPVGAPVAAPVPVGAPVAAPVPVGAPVVNMGGAYGGKGAPTGPPPPGAPLPGQPILPGPTG